MKTPYFTLCTVVVFLFSSFKPSEACNYAGSNLGYVKTQIEKAVAVSDINKSRFFTYKAIKSLHRSTEQFKACGCERADVEIEESVNNLKSAVKATSLNVTNTLLREALKNTINALEAINDHELHNSPYSSTELAMVKIVGDKKKLKPMAKRPKEKLLHKKIDASLSPYRKSLGKIVDSVNCKDARAYAEKVYKHCEQQLLRPNLSEGKKYYNLKTKEITAEAIERLRGCGLAHSK